MIFCQKMASVGGAHLTCTRARSIELDVISRSKLASAYFLCLGCRPQALVAVSRVTRKVKVSKDLRVASEFQESFFKGLYVAPYLGLLS